MNSIWPLIFVAPLLALAACAVEEDTTDNARQEAESPEEAPVAINQQMLYVIDSMGMMLQEEEFLLEPEGKQRMHAVQLAASINDFVNSYPEDSLVPQMKLNLGQVYLTFLDIRRTPLHQRP